MCQEPSWYHCEVEDGTQKQRGRNLLGSFGALFGHFCVMHFPLVLTVLRSVCDSPPGCFAGCHFDFCDGLVDSRVRVGRGCGSGFVRCGASKLSRTKHSFGTSVGQRGFAGDAGLGHAAKGLRFETWSAGDVRFESDRFTCFGSGDLCRICKVSKLSWSWSDGVFLG